LYEIPPEKDLGTIMFDVMQMLETVEETKGLDFKAKLNLCGTLLQYIAAGNDITKNPDFSKPVPVNLIPAPNFGPNKQLCVDVAQKYYFLKVTVPPEQPPMHVLTCYKNNPPCGKNLRRPHSICFHCLYLKRQRETIPEYVPVQLIIWALRSGKRFERLKNAIVKRLQEALEYLSDS
jgi:hypothetical protein